MPQVCPRRPRCWVEITRAGCCVLTLVEATLPPSASGLGVEGSCLVASDDQAALAAEAFVYGFPLTYDLQEVDRIRRSGVGSVPAAPFNSFAHASALAGPEERFVSINNDTVYSIAQLDLSAGPVRLGGAGHRRPLLRAPVHRCLDQQLRLRRPSGDRHQGRVVPARATRRRPPHQRSGIRDPLPHGGRDHRRPLGHQRPRRPSGRPGPPGPTDPDPAGQWVRPGPARTGPIGPRGTRLL